MSRIVSIQILRGIAATLVVGFHLYSAAKVEGTDPGLFAFFAGGEIGVDIFFVISGFIIYYISVNRPGITRSDFLRSRFWRILPPYWAILSLYVLSAVALAVLLGDQSKLPTGFSLMVSYLLLPYPDQVIIIAWTLCLEVLFYLIFALTYFKGGVARLIAAMILWVIASQIFSHLITDKPTWLLIPLHTAVLEFLFGIVIAILYGKAGQKLPLHIPVFLLGFASVLFYLVSPEAHSGNLGREIAAGIPSALLVYGALGFSLKGMKILETWGNSSYILYLLHLVYFSVAGKAVEILARQNVYASQAGMLALMASIVVISYASTVYLERPYQKWYHNRLLTRRRATLQQS